MRDTLPDSHPYPSPASPACCSPWVSPRWDSRFSTTDSNHQSCLASSVVFTEVHIRLLWGTLEVTQLWIEDPTVDSIMIPLWAYCTGEERGISLWG